MKKFAVLIVLTIISVSFAQGVSSQIINALSGEVLQCPQEFLDNLGTGVNVVCASTSRAFWSVGEDEETVDYSLDLIKALVHAQFLSYGYEVEEPWRLSDAGDFVSTIYSGSYDNVFVAVERYSRLIIFITASGGEVG